MLFVYGQGGSVAGQRSPGVVMGSPFRLWSAESVSRECRVQAFEVDAWDCCCQDVVPGVLRSRSWGVAAVRMEGVAARVGAVLRGRLASSSRIRGLSRSNLLLRAFWFFCITCVFSYRAVKVSIALAACTLSWVMVVTRPSRSVVRPSSSLMRA